MKRRSTLAVIIIAAALIVSGPEPAAAALPACPAAVAHRGAPGTAPENTVPGIQAAAAAGAGTVEVDVRWSSSGYPVLMHDETVDRTTPGTGRVDAKGLNALTSLLAQDYAPFKTDPRYAQTKVPYAYDFFAAARSSGVDLLLDVKPVPDRFAADKLIEYADRLTMRERMTYMSSAAGVPVMRSWYPSLRYVVAEYPAAGMTRTGESLLSLGASGYGLEQSRVSAALVAYYGAYDLPVWSWSTDRPEYDTPATWERLTRAGVAAIITNNVPALLAWQSTNCTAP